MKNGGESEELEHLLAAPDLVHDQLNGKTKSSLEEIEETWKVNQSPIYDDATTKTVEKIQERASDMGVESVEFSQFWVADKFSKSPNNDTKRNEIPNTPGENESKETNPVTNKVNNISSSPASRTGIGRASLLETAPHVVHLPCVNASHAVEDSENEETEEYDETREKLQMIRVKFLRLAHKLGQTPHNVVVAQILYRIGLAEHFRGRRNEGCVGTFSFEKASAMAVQLEATGEKSLDFSFTIMVIGKTGVGKSATINSIFDEVIFNTDAFQNGTKKVQDVIGTVQGIKVRVIDTPGILPSWSDKRENEKILNSVKRFIKKSPPDIVLYLDRLDMQIEDCNDMPLIKTITDIFGMRIWSNTIIVFTHAASVPPEGLNGTDTSYEMFVTDRSHVVQQAIRVATGDRRLMIPVSLVENHSACRKNRAGQRVLPNGHAWKPHLLLLSFASKILAEASTLLKLQDSPPGEPFPTGTGSHSLPLLLLKLLQSKPKLKFSEEQFGDDDDIDESLDSEEEREYDKLPPFKQLTKDQVEKLAKDQKKAYYAELLPSEYNDNIKEESGGAAWVPVIMLDLALPISFDSDNPTYRYREIDYPNSWISKPAFEPQSWDHDVGYDGVYVEKLFLVRKGIPVSFSCQIRKDKEDANMPMELASAIKHGKGKATSLDLDVRNLGKDMDFTFHSETNFCNYKKNKVLAGSMVTKSGDELSAGFKIKDELVMNERLGLVSSGAVMTCRGDMAYGCSSDATLILGRFLSTLGVSVMGLHGYLSIAGNLQSHIPIGKSTNLIASANLNNRGFGQVSICLNSSEQLQIVLIGLIPLIRKVFGQRSEFGQ